MSSTHQQKLAKIVSKELGIGYLRSLQAVRNAATTRRLRYPISVNMDYNTGTILANINQLTSRKTNRMSIDQVTSTSIEPISDYLVNTPDCVAGMFVRLYVDHTTLGDSASNTVTEQNFDRIPVEHVESYEWKVQDSLVKYTADVLTAWMVQDDTAAFHANICTPRDGVSLEKYDASRLDTPEQDAQRLSKRGTEYADPCWKRINVHNYLMRPFNNDSGIVEFFVRAYRGRCDAPRVQRLCEYRWHEDDTLVARYNDPVITAAISGLEPWARSMGDDISIVITGG